MKNEKLTEVVGIGTMLFSFIGYLLSPIIISIMYGDVWFLFLYFVVWLPFLVTFSIGAAISEF